MALSADALYDMSERVEQEFRDSRYRLDAAQAFIEWRDEDELSSELSDGYWEREYY